VEQRPERVADHALPSNPKVKNVNGYASTPYMYLYVVLLWGYVYLFTLCENIGLRTVP